MEQYPINPTNAPKPYHPGQLHKIQASLLILFFHSLIHRKIRILPRLTFLRFSVWNLYCSFQKCFYTSLYFPCTPLIGRFSYFSHFWHLEVESGMCSIAFVYLWAFCLQATKSFLFQRLKWLVCITLPHISVCVPSNHWKHWNPSNPTIFLSIFNLL